MVLMMPSSRVKYNAHIHVHAISGKPTVSIMGMDANNNPTPLLGSTSLDASNTDGGNPSDVDININKGMQSQPLPAGNMAMLNVSGVDGSPASLWVFVDRCTAPARF